MGRKTFSEKVANAICERIANGQSLREICRDPKMPSKATVLRWLGESESLRDQYARAREAQADHFAEEILEISDDGSNDWMDRQVGEDETVRVIDHEHVQRSKLRVDARKWLMSKMAPKKYGEKIALEHSGAIKRAGDLSDDELAAVAAGSGNRTPAPEEDS